MAKSIDQQITDVMAKKVVGRTTAIYKASERTAPDEWLVAA